MRKLNAIWLSLTLLTGCRPAQQTPNWEPQLRTANEELLTQGNLARVSEFFAETYVLHATDGDVRGRDAINAFVTALRAAFPDLRVEIQVLATEGNRVAWLRTHRGTHQGDFMGVPASGRSITWQDLVVTEYDAGMIAEEWGVSELPARIRAP